MGRRNRRGGNRVEAQIAAAERAVSGGRADAADLLALSRLYLRVGRLEPARAALSRIRDERLIDPLLAADDGSVELRQDWAQLHEELAEIETALARAERDALRQTLLTALEAGPLTPADHDRLIRLELEDGLPLHPQQPRCPACKGPVASTGRGVRCARSGQDGDYCRHTDALDLYACGSCGLVQRGRVELKGRRPRPRTSPSLLRMTRPPEGKPGWGLGPQLRREVDPFEPPLAIVEKARCPKCQGTVANWAKHANSCPRALPREFPPCPRCRQRGFHERVIRCRRCEAEIGTLPCAE